MNRKEIESTPVMSSQSTNSRRRPRDEEPPAPRRRRRIPSNRSLAIVFEVEPTFNSLREGVFAGQFHNEDTEVHAWSEVEGVGHYRWLQGPMNHLPREQQLEFIADITRQIFIFLRWYWLTITLLLRDLEAKRGGDVRDIDFRTFWNLLEDTWNFIDPPRTF